MKQQHLSVTKAERISDQRETDTRGGFCRRWDYYKEREIESIDRQTIIIISNSQVSRLRKKSSEVLGGDTVSRKCLFLKNKTKKKKKNTLIFGYCIIYYGNIVIFFVWTVLLISKNYSSAKISRTNWRFILPIDLPIDIFYPVFHRKIKSFMKKNITSLFRTT